MPVKSVPALLARDDSMEARRVVILHSLEQTGGNVTRAAARLSISRQTFWWHLRRLGMDRVPTEIRERIRRTFVVD